MNARLNLNRQTPPRRGNSKLSTLLPLLLLSGTGSALAAQQQLQIVGGWQNSPPDNSVGFGEIRNAYTTPMTVSGLGLTMSASVQPGILTASVSGAGSWAITANPPPDKWAVSAGSGLVQVGNEEALTLSVPGLSVGEAVDVTFSYYLPGQLAVSFSGQANVGAELLWQGTAAGLRADRIESHAANHPADFSVDTLPPGRIFSMTRTVATGFPFVEGHFLKVVGASSPSGVNATGSSAFNVDFASYWNGVSQVTVGGVPVSSYSLVNSDGVNFNNSFVPEPVPEPGHCAGFAAAGLLAFGLWRRHSRRA
jgi:hypothetical protein